MDLIYGNGWTKWTLDVIAQSRCENDTGKCQYSFLWLMVVVSWDRNHDDKRETGGSRSESKEEYHEKKREINFFLQKLKIDIWQREKDQEEDKMGDGRNGIRNKKYQQDEEMYVFVWNPFWTGKWFKFQIESDVGIVIININRTNLFYLYATLSGQEK